SGRQGMALGRVLWDLGVAEVQTLTVTGSPTGGTFTVKPTGTTTETAAIPYNAASSAVQTAIRALGGAYANANVTGAAGGAWTVTFERASGDIVQLVIGTNGLTGGTSPTVAGATSTAGSGTGLYGPYDSG